ncbi:hypothetical protein [Burkholderia sp. WSM2230]|uniref:hypothetical protein n=1 Tax=Burkholderia sp. WSM2230 TaxID=944435 RepID=UPI0004173B9F|nr:hypothetical protein [Burkholderia sp. WSM2230]
MFRYRLLDVSSTDSLLENAPAAAQPEEATAPVQPTQRRMPGWVRASLARPARIVGARRVELSTALFQHSTHGSASGPEHHAPGDRRFPPVNAARHARRESGPLADTGVLAARAASVSSVRGAEAEVESAGDAQRPSAAHERGAQAAAASQALRIDTVMTRADLAAYVQQRFNDGADFTAIAQHQSNPPAHQTADATALAERLYRLCATAGHARAVAPRGNDAADATDSDDTQAALRGALLADALARAGATDCRSAHLTIERIGMLDFAAPHLRSSDSGAEREAWRAARVLARSGEGREILAALRTATFNPYRDELQRLGIEVLLTSANALEPIAIDDPLAMSDPATSDPAPGALAARVSAKQAPRRSETGENAVARTSETANKSAPGISTPNGALTTLAARAFDAASTLLAHGRDALTADQQGALFAWRQSFSANGRHSDLSQTRQRLARFVGNTIPRVGEKRWKTLLPRMFRGRHGSPLSALRLGTQGVPRQTIAAEQAKVRKHLQAALPQLLQSPAMNPRAALAHARPEASLVELAALCVWLERGGFPPGRLDDDALRAIVQRAHSMCEEALQPLPAGADAAASAAHFAVARRVRARAREATASWLAMTPQQLARTKPFRSIVKRPFTVERLAVWGKVAGLPEHAPFWHTVNELHTATQHEPDARAANNVDDVRETLLDVAANLQSGQRLRLTDGGRQGVSTRGLNMTVETVLRGHGMPVSPRLDLRASRTREAVVDISRSTHGAAIFIGTAKSSMRHVGAGLLVGYDVTTALTTLRAGLVANATLHARELSEPRGVTLRVARRLLPDGSGYDDATLRAKLAGIVEHLFDESGGSHDDGPEGVWNRLASRYWDDPDVSVSWTDAHTLVRRRGVTLDANATVKVASFGGETLVDPHSGERTRPLSARTGPSAGGGWQRSRQSAQVLEHSGRVQVEEHRVGIGSQWQLRGGIAPGFSHPLDAEGRHTVGLFSIDAPAATMALRERNRSAKLLLVRDDGRLNHRGSILDIEYQDARTYTRAVDEARGELIALFAAEAIARRERNEALGGRRRAPGAPDALHAPYAPHAPHAPSPEAQAGERIDEHLANVRRNQRPNLTYVQRYRLRRHAALRLDANHAALVQADGDPWLQARIAETNASILDHPASWMATELKVKERNASARSFGPNVVLQLTTRTGAVGDREIVTEGVPFAVLETLDR